MKSAWRLCAILFLATGLVAQTSTAPKPKKARAAAETVTAADMQALKDAIASQQAALSRQEQQIQELRDELQRRDQAVQQAAAAASDAAGKAAAAQSTAAQQQDAVASLKSDVTDLKTGVNNAVMTLQETQKNVSEAPTAIHVKGITITPGGFLAAEFVGRARALAADINTPFNSLTMPGASQNHLTEFFGSGRQSRISMLAEGRLKSAKISGYVEADFLSAGVTSNNNQSNSYTLRQRQAWGQAALDNGWSLTGGQMWSLVTETKHGLDNRTEALPMTIDPQYTVGFSWARQYGLRLVKNFANKAWFGVSIENSQATVTTHNNGANFLVGAAGAGGGLYNLNANYSFNPAPDVIVKLAVEPGFGHYEIFGIYSRFRDRVFPCAEASPATPCGAITAPSPVGAFTSSGNGGGGGVNVRWSLANKHLDIGAHALGGRGVGRYGTATLSDAAAHASGSLDLIRAYQGLGTIEWHAPKFDVYINGGIEYAGRAWDFDPFTKKYVGYGSPNFRNDGCFLETLPGSGGFVPGSLANCTADTRSLVEGTVGFWVRSYNGPKGRIQWGPQFSYLNRDTWHGTGFNTEPHGLDSMVFTSFRYYLP
jgi:hypothetical protein